MRLLTFLLFFLATFRLPAQEMLYRHLTEDDGLPDNEIYFLYQDTRGIIWISTNSGLCRYNGQSFRYYSNPQLKAKSTGCIREDKYGRIWANNFVGQLFYVQGDSLVIASLKPGEEISSMGIFSFGRENQLAVTSGDGRARVMKPLHQSANEIPRYEVDFVFKEAGNNPTYTSDGMLWVGVYSPDYRKRGVVISYKDQKQSFHHIKPVPVKDNFAYGFVTEAQDGIYFYEREQNSLYKLESNSFVSVDRLDIPGIKMVVPLQNKRFAYCTNSGLFIADRNHSPTRIDQRLFSGQTISAFCEDRKGNLWVGTLTEGIYFIPKQGLSKVLPGSQSTDFSNLTSVVAGPNGKLLVGFLNGELGVLDTAFRYQSLVPANKLSVKVQALFYSNELQLLNWHSDMIYQAIFAGTETHLNLYRGVGYATKDMAYIPGWNAALMANPEDIQVISLDKEPLYKRIADGWVQANDTNSFFDATMPWPQHAILLSKERGRAVYFDKKTETAWGADKNGITLYTEKGKSAILLNGEPVYATTFCANSNIVWAGTFSQGLLAIENNRVTKQFTVHDGLASNTIYKIIASGDHLWITTDKGIQYFDTRLYRFYLFDKTLGLPTLKINGTALVNNKFYISTPKGLLFIPDSFKPSWDTDQQPMLQGVVCNGRIQASGKTRFRTAENDFVFRVETPVYNNRALLRYRYKLKGADKDYINATLDREVFEYRSLQPGRYEFELSLTDTKGNTIGTSIIYTFTIRPPFYQAVWFISICAILAALVIWIFFRKRVAQVRKRANEKLRLAELENDLAQSQLAGIKAQMNPHFMFNALNSIQEFILLNDKRQANLYMGKFADLMRMTLDMSNKNEILLEDEIRMLQLYLELEALRFEEHFEWTITSDEKVDKEHLRLPPMLIQPHVENAAKHGLLHKAGEKKLSIQFYMKDTATLCCEITDNGIGRKRSGEINAQRQKKHTSFATGATKKRLELLNFQRKDLFTMQYEDLQDSAGYATGTRVTLHIPVQA